MKLLLIEYFLLGICLSSVAAQNRSKTGVKANSFGRNAVPPEVSRSTSPASGRVDPDVVQELRDVAGKWNAWKPKIDRMTDESDGNIAKKETRNGQIDSNPFFSFEGPRSRREADSESKEKKQVAVVNEEKQSAVEEKKAEEKENTKERAKTEEIKEEEEEEEEEEAKREMKKEDTAGNENLGKAKKRRYSIRDDDDDGDQKMKRNSFKRSNSNSKLSPVAKSDRNFKQKRNEIENTEDEEEEELENLLRQRKHKSRQSRRAREDKRKKQKNIRREKHRRRRYQQSAPRRRYRNAGDGSSYRQQRKYRAYDPFLHSDEEEELQSRAYRDLGDDDSLRQRRSDQDSNYKQRSRRRRFNEGFEFANDKEKHHLVDVDDSRYEDRMVRRARGSDDDDDGSVGFYYDAVRKARGLGDEDEDEKEDNERRARSVNDNDDAISNFEARLRRFGRRGSGSGSGSGEIVRKSDERKKRLSVGDEMTEEQEKRTSDDDDDDENVVIFNEAVYSETNRVKRDHDAVDGNEGKQEANRQKRLWENEKIGSEYKDIDPKKLLHIGRKGKEQLGNTQPAEKLSD